MSASDVLLEPPGWDAASAADDGLPPALLPAIATLAASCATRPGLLGASPRLAIETIMSEIDTGLAGAVNAILHHPDFQAVEVAWRGLRFLVRATETGPTLKLRVMDISKRELARTLRKFRGVAWDQSPIFRKLYEEEYGQFGGEPYGVVVGDYQVTHHPEDVQLLADMARIAAAAHFPFLIGASPGIMHMQSWRELANPRDVTRIFRTPEYTAWRALRTDEDSRYLGLCLPHFLGRLPYGVDPTDDWAFEEASVADGVEGFVWINAAYALAANITRAFARYGWCTRIRGVDTGGVVDDLLSYRFATADGEMDRRCMTEVSLSEARESELSRAGLITLLHRKNTDHAMFVSAQSLQQPASYAEPEAEANAQLAARLPYLLACCRFAQYLKCMVRDKVGSNMSRSQLQRWLSGWLVQYTDGSPTTSSEEWKASHPLAGAEVMIEERDGMPGQYDARFFLKPHYQLEGMGVSLRLVSRLAG